MKLTATTILEGLHNKTFDVDTETYMSSPNFVQLMDKHKALLLQGSTILSVEDFANITVDLKLSAYPYIGGAAPRTIIPVKAGQGKDIVFTANESYVYIYTVIPVILCLSNSVVQRQIYSSKPPISLALQACRSTHSLSSRVGANDKSS
jgi:hypothetical protein